MSERDYEGVWRSPDEESGDIYPGLVVHDGRVAGSITIGASRVPLWAITSTLRGGGWDEVERDYGVGDIEGAIGEDGLWELIYHLFQMRGEFARLICTLADVERREEDSESETAWWDERESRDRVRGVLESCLQALGKLDGPNAETA